MLLPRAYEGEGMDGYRDQIVTCDGCFSAFQDTSTVHEVQQWHKHTVLCISLSELVSCAFSTIPQRFFHLLVERLVQCSCVQLCLHAFFHMWAFACSLSSHM